MLAAMRLASSRGVAWASWRILPTFRVIVFSIPGSFSDLPVARCWHILVDCNGERITGSIPALGAAARAALLLTVVLLPLSDVAMPQTCQR